MEDERLHVAATAARWKCPTLSRPLVTSLITASLIFTFAVPLTGCKSGGQRPVRPTAMIDKSEANSFGTYSIADFNADLKSYKSAVGLADVSTAATDEARYATATRLRDVIINRIRAEIRDHSGLFEDQFREKIAAMETGFDFANISLTLASTITGSKAGKTILSAIATATQGAAISVDKNFFREQTSEAIIASLRSGRLKQEALILAKMTQLQADKYSFEEAWNDLIDLYYAGTLASGFQNLAEQASVKSQEAAEQKLNAEKARDAALRSALELPVAPELIKLAARVNAAIGKLTDPQAKLLVTKLGITIPAGQTDQQALGNYVFEIELISEQSKLYKTAFDEVLGKGNW